ncbi:PAS domain-containing sensor histidine kinase [Mucilaginibacter sabulilitoris]|uniref:histidine kinase n=1 Tax=Mucilaginibacter sabulilitoris TaxID=1173583 RepID=A0ABZ0TK71_9SPHI|nr:PAS domain-containing sensor histidine kinase [Mucilaginibacter sabulilitoris]WPU91585.1 PAS domain-containing sensor histidine kinase [Mucilaginibacter sabulilitoris]
MQQKKNIPFNTQVDCGEYNMKIRNLRSDVAGEESTWADLFKTEMIANSINAGSWLIDIPKQYLWVCSKCKKMVPKFQEKQIKISQLREFIAPEFAEKVLKYLSSALKEPSPFEIEVPLVTAKDSPPTWFRINGVAAFTEGSFLRQIYGLIEDVSERKNQEITDLNFLAIASHDLRSPLSVIKLYLQLCERILAGKGDNYILELLKKAELQVHKMNSMIKYYLDSALRKAGEIDHFPVRFDIKELLKEEINELHLLNPTYILYLRRGPSVEIVADRQKVGQVIHNLLTNAIKYSPSTDVILVHYTKKDGYIEVVVEDRGIGIEPAHQQRIFDRFYRVKDENDTIEGYGIGLYLVKEIIKQHNGEIWVKSEVNKGTKFYFTLPFS